ncbi:uncharacterized protein [Palaemon carinicauda]|uniref:uncharacterized protein isoform X2 n=1 Tax=Palaemon carinicauda TaxID=392227 RepID=UPI0035B61C76
MESYKFWKDEGLSMGLSDEALLNFIEKKIKDSDERDRRHAEREERALMIKYEENEKQRAHELELQKIRGATSNPSHVTVAVDTTRPLPFCDTDDITAYLVRFEKVAVSLNWERNSWSVQLASLLRGKALDIYTSLSDDVTSDYASLKEALLKGFKKTSDWYRTAFKTAKMDSKSTYEQYLNMLFRNFDLWINSLSVTKDYEVLRNIIVCDQFMSTLPKEMRLFLKERKPRTPEDYSSLADTYASAHKCYPKDEQKSFRHNANLSSSSDKISASEKPEKTSSSRPGKIACYGCGQSGHISRNCPNKVPKKKSESSLEIGQVLDNTGVCGPMVCGTVNGVTVSTILRDTGCTGVVVSENLIPDPGTNCSYSTLIDYLGRKDRFPIVKIYLKCNLFTGWVNAVRAPIKYCTVLLGNIPSVQDHNLFPLKNTDSSIDVNAVTRAQVKRRNIVHPLALPEPFDISIDHESFLREQQNCKALKYAREMSQSGDVKRCKNGLQYEFVMRNGLLYRKIQKCKKPQLLGKEQLVVPVKCIKLVLRLAHDIPVSGHFSHRKTFNKINEIFWWQGMTSDIYKYCKSCDVCQKSSLVGKVKKAQMVKLPVISTPFYRVAIDLVGPISPPSEAGHRYILTMVDYASSFPEAVALKNITSEDIAEALISIFSRVGVPKEILSDRGPQFRSELMLQVHKLLGVKPLFSTPYHPAANGRIERQHQILKSILKKICELKHNQWHRFLPAALFAMREIPSDTTGFSPFEILYGRQVRGPLTILKELWTNSDMSTGETDLYSFVLELREKLSDVSDLAVQNMNISSSTYKSYFDLKSSKRRFKADDEVILLIPEKQGKLQFSWRGPYKIIDKHGPVDYWVNVEDKPGKTSLQEHNIKIKTTETFVRKYYPIPAHLTKDFDDEVQSLLDLGIIEQSSSNYSSPALLVKKKEGNYRLVVDFRTLNAITDFDCEPMPSFEQDLHKFADFMYITELDICKAYHQIPLTPESRKYTAFSTNLGLMQYVRLPFGLSTACATYIRLMRQVLKGLSFVVCYFDNIFIVSKDWKIHMADLETVILRLQEAGLTAKPGKCFLGYEEIQYLGYVINKRGIFPQQDKIGAILDMPAPTTKKQLRSFIGSVNFYGRFVPNLSDKLIHLTKFLKKGSSEKFNFDEDALCKFNELKSCLTSPPILQVPDLNNIFCLRTDASSTGLGAVLLQYIDGEPYPVAFASKKLLPPETRYAAIERECLAIVWGIKKFEYYLMGRKFLLESDHKPLMYLETSKSSNDRLMRWSLALQVYSFSVVHVKGTNNIFADLLSRG